MIAIEISKRRELNKIYVFSIAFNTVTVNYASASVAFVHPFKRQFRTNSYIHVQYDRQSSRKYITTFVVSISPDR